MEPLISCKGLNKKYPGQPDLVIRDVTFDLELGQGLFIHGPNGSGKTTLLRLLSGTLAPDSGTITLAQESMTCHSTNLRRKIGWVPSNENSFFMNASAFRNLQFWAVTYGLSVDQLNQRLDEWEELFALRAHIHKPIQELSAGFKRRLSVFRALVHDPQLLLLDEPFSFLDKHQRSHLAQFLRHWREQKRRAVVLTSHIEFDFINDYQPLDITKH